MASIERFVEEVEKCSAVTDRAIVAELLDAVQAMRPFVAHVGALFTESILVFAITSLEKANADPKSKKRNAGLVSSQVVQVKGNKFGITQDMIHTQLWQKAEQLLEQQPESKPAKMPS